VARALKPVLVVLIGLPGAGKSTLARALCRRRGWSRVDRDAMPVKDVRKQAANAEVWREVTSLLRRRRSVVVDGMTFASREQRARARAVARRCDARCVEAFLDCPVELARARVAADSGHPARDRTPALVDEVAGRFEPVSRRVLRLDARRPAAAALAATLRRIGRAGRDPSLRSG
jgi:predicted kinase